MTSRLSLIAILTALCLGCGFQAIQKDSPVTNEVTTGSNPIAPQEEHDDDIWTYYYNLKSDSLELLYDTNAVKILSNGDILEGKKQIAAYILSNPLKIVFTKSDTLIVANGRMAIDYEINESTYDNNEKIKTLVIWQTKNQERKRVFEFSAKVEPTTNNQEEIDKRRDLWISLCNEHDARNLILEMYSQNTIYFNHKPIVQGIEHLVREYQYMNSESYTLTLQPIVTKFINDNFIFEIGQCAGSYNGKYILIWQKDIDGKWRIFIDSNI